VSGIDFANAPVDYSGLSAQLKGANIRVCYFIEPEIHSVKGAAKAGADAVLINCRDYANARTVEQAQEALDRIDQAAGTAAKHELVVRAGGGVDYRNVGALVELGFINEFVVGHAVTSRALLVGFGAAVTEMLRLVRPQVTPPA
jgi:pyridoxine 5-phosphate synthase